MPLIAAASAVLAALLGVVVLAALLPARAERQRLRILAEQILAGQRSEAETTRRQIGDAERALTAAIQSGTTDALGRAFAEITTATKATGERTEKLGQDVREQLGDLRTAFAREQGEARVLLEAKLRELAEGNATKLAEIQRSVNEQLHEAVEKQMTASFQRVIDQFAAVQKAMGDVQAVTAQIGDIKRIFSNVKTRGGWGETQLRALLDDVLPPGSYETNKKLRAGSDDAVEFAIAMPVRGEERPFLAIDSKFPMEDYERLLAAAEVGDAEAERAARRGLEARVKLEARKIASKYINPPVTVEFAVMYLPTDGLYAEIARCPGLIDEIGSQCRVVVLGPSLAPALLRTIHLGFVTLALEQKADEIRTLLGATRSEMQKMDDVLARLGKQAGTMSNTIEAARRRTRAVSRKLRGVEAVEGQAAERLLELTPETLDEAEAEEIAEG